MASLDRSAGRAVALIVVSLVVAACAVLAVGSPGSVGSPGASAGTGRSASDVPSSEGVPPPVSPIPGPSSVASLPDGSPTNDGRSAPVGVPYSVGQQPSGLSFIGGGLWMADYGADLVRVYDVVTMSETGIIPVGRGLEPSSIVSDGKVVFVTRHHGGVAKVDAVTRTVVGVAIAADYPDPAPVIGAGSLWVIVRAPKKEIVRLDTGSLRVQARIAFDGPVDGLEFAGGLVWGSSAAGVFSIDPATDRVSPTGIPGTPRAAMGASVWVVPTFRGTPLPDADHLLRIDTKTRKVTATIPLDVGVSVALPSLAVGGGALWLLHDGANGSEIVKIDPRMNAEVGALGVPGSTDRGLYFGAGCLWILTGDRPTLVRVPIF